MIIKLPKEVWLDPQNMAHYGFSVEEIERADATDGIIADRGDGNIYMLDKPITVVDARQVKEALANERNI